MYEVVVPAHALLVCHSYGCLLPRNCVNKQVYLQYCCTICTIARLSDKHVQYRHTSPECLLVAIPDSLYNFRCKHTIPCDRASEFILNFRCKRNLKVDDCVLHATINDFTTDRNCMHMPDWLVASLKVSLTLKPALCFELWLLLEVCLNTKLLLNTTNQSSAISA